MFIDLATLLSKDVVLRFLEGSDSEKIPLFLVLDGHGGSGVAETGLCIWACGCVGVSENIHVGIYMCVSVCIHVHICK